MEEEKKTVQFFIEKENSHVYITKYKITDLFLEKKKMFIDLCFFYYR